MRLPTDYQDDILDTTQNTKRIYDLLNKLDGSTYKSDIYLNDKTVYTQNGSSFSASDINAICRFVNLLCTKRVYNVASNLWTANPDASTNTMYPYIAVIATTDFDDDSTPVWQMGGAGNLPTSTEKDAIDTVAQAVFTSTGITLYAEGAISVALKLEIMGV